MFLAQCVFLVKSRKIIGSCRSRDNRTVVKILTQTVERGDKFSDRGVEKKYFHLAKILIEFVKSSVAIPPVKSTHGSPPYSPVTCWFCLLGEGFSEKFFF